MRDAYLIGDHSTQYGVLGKTLSVRFEFTRVEMIVSTLTPCTSGSKTEELFEDSRLYVNTVRPQAGPPCFAHIL